MKNKYLTKHPIFPVLTFLALSACKTSGDIHAEKMHQDSGEIRTIGAPVEQQQAPARKAVQQSQQQVQQQQQAAANEDLAREIEVLKGKLQEKDYLSQQEKMQTDARIASLEQDKARLTEEIQILKGTAPAQAAAGGDLLWDAAQKDLKAKKYAAAVTNLRDFLENFPNDPRIEEAQIIKGQCEYAAEQFKPSLVSFGNYLDKYPKGKYRAMAWLGQGTSLIRLKQKKDAKLFLEQCVALHPKSKEAKVAKRLLKTPNFVPPTIFI